MDKKTDALRKVLHDYAVPDPKIVSKLPKGGATLDFVGHADITRILIEIDPEWQIEPAMVDMNGLPAVVVTGNMVQAGFWMTLLGQSRYCVGSVEERKGDRYKELLSDGIRNGAMRFGIALHLWTKAEWQDLAAPSAPAKATPVIKPVTKETIAKFIEACTKENLDHDQVADHAGVDLAGNVTNQDLVKLRESFKTLKGQK